MKRRIFKLCLFVLLGAIFNVAVAWVQCIRAPFFVEMDFSGHYTETAQPTWHVVHVFDNGAMLIVARATRYMKRVGEPACASWPYWSWTAEPPTAQVARDEMYLEERVYGWPMFAMFNRTTQTWNDIRESMTGRIRIRWPPNHPLNTGYRIFPTFVIWPGFAINTIFYAAILWLLLAFPFTVRRFRRIKRGLCPACAYPVGDSAVCTECGKAVRA